MSRWIVLPLGAALIAVQLHALAGGAGLNLNLLPSAAVPAESAARTELLARPLDARAYFALALAQERLGQRERARGLVERSAILDPRLRPARLWLLAEAVRAASISQAITHARILVNLSAETTPQVSALLAELSRDPRHRALIAAEFADTPLVLAIAQQAAQGGLEADGLLELLAETDLAALPAGVATAQSIVTDRLLRDRRYGEARRAWYALAGYSPSGAVFDGTFKDLAGPPPFGWKLQAGPNVETAIDAAAGPAGAGALIIRAFGSLSVVAAEQALVLAPGTHVLAFSSSAGDSPAQGADFLVTVQCEGRPVLVELAVRRSASGWSAQQAEFAVPAGCPMQTLRIAKARTADQGTHEVSISRLSITLR